jgi:hypothetical protein
MALAAAGAALVGLAACSQTAAPTAVPTNRSITPPVSCSHQYHTWQHMHGKGLLTALSAVSSAETVGGARALTAALKEARPTVARAAHYPLPACADPLGYWSVLLMHVNAAATGKGPASALRAAMKDVPAIHHRLMAEIKRVAR